MTTAVATQPAAPLVLCDVDDLAEADLDAHLAERLEDAGRLVLRADAAGASGDQVGQVISGRGTRPGRADAVELARAVRAGADVATGAHHLGLRAAVLLGD